MTVLPIQPIAFTVKADVRTIDCKNRVLGHKDRVLGHKEAELRTQKPRIYKSNWL